MENELVEYLKPILETLEPDDAIRIMRVVHHEVKNRALVTWCNAITGHDTSIVTTPDGRTHARNAPVWSDWRILQRSPIDPDTTVWAMVQCDDGIVVFSVVEVETEEGKTGYAFHREVLRDWKQCAGPVDHRALVKTLERFMVPDDSDGICPACGQEVDLPEGDDQPTDTPERATAAPNGNALQARG